MGDGSGDLFRSPNSTDRVPQAHLILDPCGGCGALFLEERSVALGADRTQRDGIDPDAARALIDRHGPGQKRFTERPATATV